MRALGSPLPSFSLPDTVSGRTVSSTDLAGKPAVVIFICNHCPYVLHIRQALADFGRFCRDNGVAMVAISSNDALAYPQDGPQAMALEAERAGYVFPYLFDETQIVALAFEAACTPDLYVYDAAGALAYRGQFDDSRPKTEVVATGKDARLAVQALLSGGVPSIEQTPSIGCNIKWKVA